MTLLEIYNIALKPHGKRCSESDLQAENPPYEVELCNTYYRSAVRKALGEADWPEAMRYVEPIEAQGIPKGKWAHAFLLPKNMTRVAVRSTKPYDLAPGVFLSNSEHPEIYVISSQFDCEKVSDGLCELVGLALAYILCGLLSPADNNISQVIMQNYNWTLSPMISAISTGELRSEEEGGPIGFEYFV